MSAFDPSRKWDSDSIGDKRAPYCRTFLGMTKPPIHKELDWGNNARAIRIKASLFAFDRKTVERSIKKVRSNHHGVTHA